MIVGSCLGAVAGLIGGYYFSLKKENHDNNERVCSFYKNLRDTLQFNMDRSDHMKILLEKDMVPNFLYDVSPISELLFSTGHLLRYDPQFNKWNWIRYKMGHINNAISMFDRTKESQIEVLGLHGECHKELYECLSELSSRTCACSL